MIKAEAPWYLQDTSSLGAEHVKVNTTNIPLAPSICQSWMKSQAYTYLTKTLLGGYRCSLSLFRHRRKQKKTQHANGQDSNSLLKTSEVSLTLLSNLRRLLLWVLADHGPWFTSSTFPIRDQVCIHLWIPSWHHSWHWVDFNNYGKKEERMDIRGARRTGRMGGKAEQSPLQRYVGPCCFLE